MRFLTFLAFTALLTAATGAAAGDGTDLTRTRVQLDARASMEVDNDSMRATLFTEIEESGASRAADRVNRASREAIEALKGFSGLRIRSAGYRTFPVSEKGRIVRWRARAEVVVEGEDFARVSEAAGRVQDRMQLAGVEFFVSATRRAQVEANLTQDAIAEFLDKAAQGSGFHVAEASVSSDGAFPPPQPMMMMRAMTADAAPAFEGGSTRLGVTVSGAVLILR
jgi:predicted secreted protein